MDKILESLTKPLTHKSWPLEPGDGDMTESPTAGESLRVVQAWRDTLRAEELKDAITADEVFDMMQKVCKVSKFATREGTIAAALEVLSEKGLKPEELGFYDHEIRKRVPLEA
jgi:hypothetical protein